MRRREFLRSTTTAATAALAGCGLAGSRSEPTSASGGTPTSTPKGTPTSTPETVGSVGGVDLPVPADAMRVAVAKDYIPAIVEPAFAADWSGLDAPPDHERPLLPDDSPIIGVTRDGDARAYPLRILNWHEVVNDTFGGPLLVTYCVLCGSGVVAERVAAGEETVFGVSGRLWREDLVLYDHATESLWSQLLAAAIRGPLTGERLSLVPSTLTTWGEWRARHPDGTVLLPPPHSNTVRGPDATFEYFESKYHYESQDQLVGFDSDGTLAPRTLVLGIEHGGTTRAYPFGTVRDAGVVNDRVGGLPVVVTVTPANSLAAYVRTIGGTELWFTPSGSESSSMDAGGSRWERATGRAVDGPHAGTQLDRATETAPMFWTGWSNFHPETEVYQRVTK